MNINHQWKWGKSLDSNGDTQMGIFPSDKITMIVENEKICTDTKQVIGESIKENLTDKTNRIAHFTYRAASGYTNNKKDNYINVPPRQQLPSHNYSTKRFSGWQ